MEDLDLRPIIDPMEFPLVVHGTSNKTWKMIKADGLTRMGRNHIHFVPGALGDPEVVSGMRKSSDGAIYIDMAKAMGDSIRFFLSNNRVILTSGDENGTLHPRYFDRAIRRVTQGELPFGETAGSTPATKEQFKSKDTREGDGVVRERAVLWVEWRWVMTIEVECEARVVSCVQSVQKPAESATSGEGGQKKKRQFKNYACPVPGCTEPITYPKANALKHHVPSLFGEFDEAVCRRRAATHGLPVEWCGS